MYKASIELCKIGSIKLKFGLIIHGDTDAKYNTKLLSKFNYLGSDYIRLNPKPFITIDISSKDEIWTANSMVNLGKISLYSFIKALSAMVKEYKEIKDLYYYQNGKLVLNHTKATEIYKDIVANNNKRIRLIPTVVPDDNNSEKFYEGCILCINSYDNFAYISYSEMEYLLYELTHIDMNSLSLQLINTVTLFSNMESEQLSKKPETVTEEILDSNDDMESGTRPIPEGNTIPDI